MTIFLGALTLSDHLYLDGIDNATGVAISQKRTLGGRSVVQVGPTLDKGRTLSLQSEGHITHAQVGSIKAMEKLGQEVTLTHPRGTFSVIIAGTELEPDELLSNPDSAAAGAIWYSGTITLIEV